MRHTIRMAAATAILLTCGSGLFAAQWLNDMRYGNGSDGPIQIGANTTDVPVDSSCGGTINTSSLTATNASFAVGKPILIHQTSGTGAGQWELNFIDGYDTGVITTRYPLSYTYSSSGNNRAQVIMLKQYSTVTVSSGYTWYCKSWNGTTGGILAFLCKGTVNVAGTITASGRAFSGGSDIPDYYDGQPGWCGHGTGGPTARSYGPNGNGGGAGTNKSNRYGGGGGGGGHASNGGNGSSSNNPDGGTCYGGNGGSATGTANLSTMTFGGGGGCGGTGQNRGQAGGRSGGIIAIFAKTIYVTGSISSGGNNGNCVTPSVSGGGGGGGAGGSILIKAETADVGTSKMTVAAGAAGSLCGGNGNNSGAGSVGRMAVHSYNPATGSSSPTITKVTDTNLIANASPEAFALLTPSDLATVTTATPTFTWEASSDPEGLAIRYAITFSHDSGFNNIYRTVSGLREPAYRPIVGEELGNGTYYWKVTASDGEISTPSTDTRQITVNAAALSVPVINGVVGDLDSGKIVRILGLVPADHADQPLSMYQWDSQSSSYAALSGSVGWHDNGFTFSPLPALDSGARLYVASNVGEVDEANSRTSVLEVSAFRDVFHDAATFHGSGPGSSMRLEKDTAYSFRIAANAGSEVVVTAYVMKNAQYSGAQPTLTLRGPGIAGTGAATTALSAAAGTWQQLTVRGTPTAAGILTLELQTASTATDSATWIDDIAVSQ